MNKSLKTCRTKGGEVEEYLKEADVPLVGCFANDTENRFTAGIDNNSEEIKQKFTSYFEPHFGVYHVSTNHCSVTPESELSDPAHEGTLTQTSVSDS